jgi:hypothetical protein
MKMQKAKTYFVYKNWQVPGHKARIHLGDCSWCKSGKGIHPEASEEHGRWDGPFDTLKDAIVAAKISGGVMSLCKRCDPR